MVASILGIDYMVVLRGANEVLITIVRSMLYVSPHNNISKLLLQNIINNLVLDFAIFFHNTASEEFN